MLPYYILITAPLFFAFCYELFYEVNGRRGVKKNYTIIIFFVIYFFLLAFRNENIGVDVSRYLQLFEIVSKYDFRDIWVQFQDSDLGYYFLSKIISIIFRDEQWLLIIVALMTTVPIAWFYYRETKNSLVTISLFMVMPVFQMNFSGLRQAIAIAFVVPALAFVQNRQWKKFVLVVILAMSFHNSAFIMLLMYPFYHWKVKARHMFWVLPLSLIVYRFNSQIYLFTLAFFEEKYQERYAEITDTGAYTMLFVFLAFLIYVFFFTSEQKYTYEEKGLRNYLIIVFILQMFAPINNIAMRMNYYYIPFVPVVITQATNKLKINNNRIKWIISLVMYMLFTFYYLDKSLSVDSLDIYPYEFLFNT